METFPIPAKEQVSPENQVIFDNLNKLIGFVPNLYAVFAHSKNALGNYLTLQNGKTLLRAAEREVIRFSAGLHSFHWPFVREYRMAHLSQERL